MRLKKLLGFAMLGALTCATATASVSQLSGVSVKGHDKEGLVTILASGPFTHTEYRPTENLMLIDLAGVSTANADRALHTVYVPGLRSYRVVGYRSANGSEITRVELNLMARTKAQISDVAGGVEVHLTGAAAAVPSKEMIAALADARTTSDETRTPEPVRERIPAAPMTRIRAVTVAHGEESLDVQITGNGPMTAKTMKLTGPDRLVVDIPNSTLEGRAREIAVNSASVKDVRVGRFQADPPVTRIVVDLASLGDYNLIPEGNKLVVKLHESNPVRVAQRNNEVAEAAPISAKPSVSDLAPTSQQSGAALSKPENSQSRADAAAAHFAHNEPTVPAFNQPPYGNSSLGVKPSTVNAALQQQTQAGATVNITGPVSTCTSGRYTGEPIGLNFKDLDLKDFFKVIQEISGLNVVLDPAVKGSVSIYLNDVPWDQALAIVLNNNGLECQLQGNVLRIATLQTLKIEADERRAQQDAQALAVPKQTITRYLSYGQSRDAAPIVKKFLSPRGDVVADPRSNALIIEDIPSTLPKVEELIKALDRRTAEVEIEARVVASTRSFARDIGTQLAIGFASGHSTIFGNPANGNSPVTTNIVTPSTTPGGAPTLTPTTGNLLGTAGQIPLFSNLPAAATSGLGFSTFTNNFRLDFILSAAETRGLVKILSRPHITTQNNIAATVKQGAQIPVVTQAQLGGPPTVQYIAAFLRLTVTPQITADNTIFLNLDVENTTPDFSKVSGAQLNPALDTQQATTSVLVKDGGTVVIGGVVQTQNQIAVAQVPVLGSIPILGNLFKRTNVNTSTVELIFFITPKIIET